MGRLGSLAFSFLRGVKREDKYQKVARIGKNVIMVVRLVLDHVSLSTKESEQGTLIRSATRARLENRSAPGPSAGSTPSLIDGD
jgi:hypothetical protein